MFNKYILKSILVFTVLFFLSAGVVRGEEKTVSESGSIKKASTEENFDFRVQNLEHFLESHNSPLSPYAHEFVAYADKYGMDYRLVPAITGVESTFGKRIPKESYNAYGWANGDYKFESWEQSIEHVNMILRTKYVDKGAVTLRQISRRYAPPSKTWAGKVTFFINKIDSLPVTYDI